MVTGWPVVPGTTAHGAVLASVAGDGAQHVKALVGRGVAAFGLLWPMDIGYPVLDDKTRCIKFVSSLDRHWISR